MDPDPDTDPGIIRIPETPPSPPRNRSGKRRRQEDDHKTSAIIYESAQPSPSEAPPRPARLESNALLARWATIIEIQQRPLSIPKHPSFTQSPFHEQISNVVCEIAEKFMGRNVEKSKKTGIELGKDLTQFLQVCEDLLQACNELFQQYTEQCGSCSQSGVDRETALQVETMRMIIKGFILCLCLQMASPLHLRLEMVQKKEEGLKKREKRLSQREKELAGREKKFAERQESFQEDEEMLRLLPDIPGTVEAVEGA